MQGIRNAGSSPLMMLMQMDGTPVTVTKYNTFKAGPFEFRRTGGDLKELQVYRQWMCVAGPRGTQPKVFSCVAEPAACPDKTAARALMLLLNFLVLIRNSIEFVCLNICWVNIVPDGPGRG